MSTGWFSSSSRPYPKIFSVCELMSTMRPWSSTPTMASGADSSRSPNQRSAVAPRSTPGVASDGRSRVPARAAGGGSEALRARGFELRGVRPMPPPPPSRGSSYYAFRPIAWSEVSGTARVLHRPRKCAVPAFTGLASGLAFQAWLGPAVYACASMRGDCPLLGSGNCTRRAPRTRRSAAEHPREQPRRDVARLRVRVGRHRPVFDEQLPEAAHDDGEAEGREHLVVVEVPDAAVDELLVARDRLLPPWKAREALDPNPLAVEPIEEEPPGEGLLGVAERRHLPVEDGAATGAREDHVPDARIAPAKAERLVGRAVAPEPDKARLDDRLGPAPSGPRQIAGVVVELRVEARRAVREEVEAEPPPVEPVDAREDLEPVPPERRARGRRDLGHPARRVVWRVVGWDASLDPSHHEEAGAEHGRPLLEPVHGRHGHVRRLAEPLHDAELLADVVGGEDGEAARLDGTTIPWRRARPSSVHSRSKRSVSFEKPVAAGGARFVIARSRACGIRRASQGASCRRVASGSRCWGSGIGRGSSPAEGRTRAAELSSDETAPPRTRDVARGRYGRDRRVALGLGAAATGDLLLRRTCSSRSSISNGFLTQPAAPRRAARSSALACADTTTTGIDARAGSRSCCARNCSPSITGIMRSSRMSEGGGMVCSRSSASLPFAALTTRWPSYSRIGTSASRRSKSSSTTRTVVAPSFISSGMVSHCRPDRFVSQEGAGAKILNRRRPPRRTRGAPGLGPALAWETEACRSSRAAIWTPPSP